MNLARIVPHLRRRPWSTRGRASLIATVMRVLGGWFIVFLIPGIALAQDWPDLSQDLPKGEPRPHDVAVIVSIEDYFHVPPVVGAQRNAEDWHRWLLVSRGVDPSNVRLLSGHSATREAMLEEAEWAAERAGEQGVVWWVFIGHGAPAKNGQDGLLVGSDAQGTARSLYARSVKRGEILDRLKPGKQAHAVMILDACFSGKSPEGELLVDGLQLLVPVTVGGQSLVTVLTAGAPDQFAGPLPGSARPAFSYLLLGALRGWGDADGDGKVTAREAIRYVEGVFSTLVTDRRQTPGLEGPDSLVLGEGKETGPDLLRILQASGEGGEPPPPAKPTQRPAQPTNKPVAPSPPVAPKPETSRPAPPPSFDAKALQPYPEATAVRVNTRGSSATMGFRSSHPIVQVFDHFDRLLREEGWIRVELDKEPDEIESIYRRGDQRLELELEAQGRGRYTLELEWSTHR